MKIEGHEEYYIIYGDQEKWRYIKIYIKWLDEVKMEELYCMDNG